MKKPKRNLSAVCVLLILLSVALTSCSQVKAPLDLGESKSASKAVAPQKLPEQAETGTESEGAKTESKAKTDRLVIRKKSLSMQVDDVRKTYKRIDKIASKYEGRITNASISSDQYPQIYPTTPEEGTPPSFDKDNSDSSQDDSKTGPLYATIVIKVPSNRTSAALKEIKQLGKIETEHESEEEVTEQYVDLNARLRNLQREEQRYLNFFNAAKTVEDMLKIEEQLTKVRGEIESLQAQIDQLEKSARMGTITVYLHEPTQISKPIKDWGFVEAVLEAVQNFVAVINFMIRAFGALLPLLILILIVVLVIKLILRRRQRTS